MTETRIHLLTSIHGFILLVFYSDQEQWQFRIISGSVIFGERKLYFSATAAQKAGREWIEAGRWNVGAMTNSIKIS